MSKIKKELSLLDMYISKFSLPERPRVRREYKPQLNQSGSADKAKKAKRKSAQKSKRRNR